MMPEPPCRRSRRQILAGGALLLGAGLAGCGGSVPSALPRPELPPFPGNTAPALLVDPAGLSRLREEHGESLVVLDASDRADYRAGHIPGAVHTHWQETIERDAAFYGTVLAPADGQARRLAWMQRHGIDPDRTVLVYERGDGRRAARLVWFLRFLGHDRAAMLDGGVAAWRGAGFPIASGIEHAPQPRSTPAVAPRAGFYEGRDQAMARRDDPTRLVLDIRSATERDEQPPTAADLAPCVWLPWTALIDPATGGFIPPAETAARLASVGADADRDILLVGRYGVDTNAAWLALRLQNIVRITCFDPGWGEWSRADNPVQGMSATVAP